MKTIIAGSRLIANKELIFKCIEHYLSNYEITEVVCGMAIGVDLAGKDWADENGIYVSEWKPDYKDKNVHPRAAPKVRNKKMGDYAEQLLCIWDGQSTGTLHMYNYMKQLNKHRYLINMKEETIKDDRLYAGISIPFV